MEKQRIEGKDLLVIRVESEADPQEFSRISQEITDEVRVTVAGQASLLLLNRKTRFFPHLKTIYVYPHTYMAKT